jgi:anti-sigma factor RsiW
MTNSEPNDLPPELLAAYADGELGPNDRARVEQWVADHPEARELLEDQEALGPRNVEFWQAVSPPEPSPRVWEATLRGIRDRSRVPPSRRWLPWVSSLALVATATAATVLFVLPAGPGGPGDGPELTAVRSPATEPDDEPFAMASADEVRIVSLPESAAHLLVVGEHPLGNTLIVLARADEIEFFGVNTDPSGRFPEVPTEVAPDDAPMIWAPKEP